MPPAPGSFPQARKIYLYDSQFSFCRLTMEASRVHIAQIFSSTALPVLSTREMKGKNAKALRYREFPEKKEIMTFSGNR